MNEAAAVLSSLQVSRCVAKLHKGYKPSGAPCPVGSLTGGGSCRPRNNGGVAMIVCRTLLLFVTAAGI